MLVPLQPRLPKVCLELSALGPVIVALNLVGGGGGGCLAPTLDLLVLCPMRLDQALPLPGLRTPRRPRSGMCVDMT